jgi:hypothetical protein
MSRWSEKLTLNNILKFGLGTFLFLLPWQTIYIIQERIVNGGKWQYGTIGFYATEILLWVNVVLFMIWFYRRWKEERGRGKGEFRLTRDRIFVLSILVFVLYCFATALWAGDKQIAFQHAFHILEAVLLFLMIYLGPLDFEGAGKPLVAGAVVQSILGIGQVLFQNTFAFKWLGLVAHNAWESGTSVIVAEGFGRWLRAYGAFSHPNIFGGYLALTFLVTMVLHHRLQFKNKLTECLFFFVPAVQLVALFFTFSRTAWLAVILVLVFYLHLIKSRPSSDRPLHFRMIVYSLILFAILDYLFFPLIQSRIMGQGELEIRSTTERVIGYDEAWTIARDNFLFGVGAGNYTVSVRQNNPGLPGWFYQPVHNAIVLGLVEIGAVGMFLFFLVFFVFFSMQALLVKSDRMAVFLFLLISAPLLLLDHYILSSYVGLLVGMIYLTVFLRIYPVKL